MYCKRLVNSGERVYVCMYVCMYVKRLVHSGELMYVCMSTYIHTIRIKVDIRHRGAMDAEFCVPPLFPAPALF
jgi:hypothetical protein